MPKHNISKERRLGIYFGLIAVFISFVPMFGLYLFASDSASQLLHRILSSELKQKAVLVATDIDRFYAERMDDIRVLSQADVLETDNHAAIAQYLAEVAEGSNHLKQITVATIEGVVIARAHKTPQQTDHLNESYPLLKKIFTQVLIAAQGDVYVSELTDTEQGGKGILFVTPVTDESNQHVIKLLVIETDLSIPELILAELSDTIGSDETRIHLVDNLGRVISSTMPEAKQLELLPDLENNPFLLNKFARQGDVGSASYTDSTQSRVIAGYADLAEFGINQSLDWSIIAIIPTQTIADYAYALKLKMAVMSLFIACLVFIGMFLFSRKIMQFIWEQANYDFLTALPNRRLFIDRLNESIKLSQRTELPSALFYVDLDNFKEINDSQGHHIGDELLVMASQRIRDNTRAVDTVARIGGDEFAIIVSSVTHLHNIDQIAQNIIDCLTRPFNLKKDIYYSSASIGITLYPMDGLNANQLLQNADQAMYKSKAHGGSCFSYFTNEMQLKTTKRAQLIRDLREALPREQLHVFYQPIVDSKTSRITRAEALIRWIHPDLGMISPLDFIPVAEETGLISEIGDWVFLQALEQVKELRESYDPDFQISINVSPVQFKCATLQRQWLGYLQDHKVSGKAIVIEITEGILMEKNPVVTDQLLSFRDAEIQIAIDDFGTGYSSLSYLKKFHIDYIKIDKAFIDDIATDESDYALCEAITVMADKLGMEIIAEGIETQAQIDVLTSIACEYFQGYFFSKPLPAVELNDLLKASKTRPLIVHDDNACRS